MLNLCSTTGRFRFLAPLWLFLILTLLLSLAYPLQLRAATDHCSVCNALLADKVYLMTDRVTGERKQICPECVNLPKTCFRCGIPVKKDFTEIADGRVLCERDAKDAVMDDQEARQIIADVQNALERLFARFTSFPSTNVQTAVVDRVNLQALLALPGGNDYSCPNVLGYTQSITNNQGRLLHKISLMSGLPRGEIKAVCAHELSHAWIHDNVPIERRRALAGDAHEGFCELVAYLLMDAQGDEDEKKAILQNRYTRGHIHLFVDAENRFGFNEVIDWMKSGQDTFLHGEDLNRLRNLRPTAPKKPATFAAAATATAKGPGTSAGPNGRTTAATTQAQTQAQTQPQAPAGPAKITLKGISWARNRPLCVINDETFEPNEQGRIRLGNTNVLIRCLAIRPDGVTIRMVNSGEEKMLALDSQ